MRDEQKISEFNELSELTERTQSERPGRTETKDTNSAGENTRILITSKFTRQRHLKERNLMNTQEEDERGIYGRWYWANTQNVGCNGS